MKNKKIAILELLLLLWVFFNISSVFTYLFTFLGFDLTNFNDTDLAYATVLINLVISLLLIIIYHPILANDWQIFKSNLKNNLRTCISLFLLLFGIKIITSVVTNLVALSLGISFIESENQEVINALTGGAPLMMFISAVVLAPFIEEGIFRVGFRRVFTSKYWFIIISGIFFGLMHIFPTELSLTAAIIQSIIYVVMGVTIAVIYEKYQNVYFVIAIHALNNLIGILAFLFWL